ncbi:MAG: MlaE family lipid ABC transporter permease subunit [Deltaproteobacteria bacterium]|nr:MlaE family lipid ABC transporter permease subunit [Deltaproteobacteria bacterium]MBW2305456.1 MlaE family lipid ABC transporter permease subunit [Deltaproteobacteria bacterium]
MEAIEAANQHLNALPSVSVDTDVRWPELLTLTIKGRLDSNTTGGIWREVTDVLERTSPTRLVVEASRIDYCDGAGIGLLMELRRRQHRAGGEVEIRGLRAEFKQLLDLFAPAEFEEPITRKPKHSSLPEEIGRATFTIWEDTRMLITFVGELSAALFHASLNPLRVRWKDVLRVAETAGVNALPIIALISFLVGLIMAFQSAIPMRQFGAEIFVANLIGLSMLRELGPLMTAIVLAGRTGSAFAAELGTMKVNEEIDALTTMGLDPVRFLVVPRVIAAVVMTPLLTVFADLLGVIGGSFVLLSLGYPIITYFNQILSSVTYVDLAGGLFKSFIFGILIAGIGCLRGLQTESGASGVGESTTRAVVSGIILIVLTDGVFSVAYYYLGI